MVVKKKLYNENSAVALCLAGLLSILIAFRGLAEEAAFEAHELDMVIGNPEAPVTLIDYSSLTCPHCATFHLSIFPKLYDEYIYTNKVKVIFREVYFDGPGLWASMVARCSDQEAFFPIIDLLFRKQGDWSRGDSQSDVVNGLVSIGKQSGLSKKEILNCLKDKNKAKSLVEWYRSNALNDSIESTPTILINGNKMPNMSYPELSREIETYLND